MGYGEDDLPDAVWLEFWADVILRGQRYLEPGERDCDYTPWQNALKKVCTPPERLGLVSPPLLNGAERLIGFAWRVAMKPWPQECLKLKEFALIFLEADVMLRESGYAKARLLRRLRQVPLSDGECRRIANLVRRAVLRGYSIEGFRQLKKLNAQLMKNQKMPGMSDWLQDLAQDAIIPIMEAHAGKWPDVIGHRLADDEIMGLLLESDYSGNPYPKLAVTGPHMTEIVPAGAFMTSQKQRTARNAWRFLQAARNYGAKI